MAETDTTNGVDTMSGSDALLWTISADPVMRPTIVALLVLDSTPDWAEVRARIASLTEFVPRLRSRAVNRPGRGRPQFVPDETFDLDVHLRRMRLPEHGGLRAVLDLAQTMATSGFDPALPLWEAVLVEGVDAHSAALVIKVHHSVIDGVGGLTVLAHLFDNLGAGRRAPRLEDVPQAEPGHASPLARLGDLPDAVRLVDDAMDALVHPFRSFGRLAALGTSVARLMAPAGTPISPIMTGRSFRRHADVFDLDLQTVKQAAKTWGGTINDVFVASVMRGLALYHEQHGVVSPGFRALMPVNVRTQSDPTGGNHFVPARFVIPDPRRRRRLRGRGQAGRRGVEERLRARLERRARHRLECAAVRRRPWSVGFDAAGQRRLRHQHPGTPLPRHLGWCGGRAHLRPGAPVGGRPERVTDLRG